MKVYFDYVTDKELVGKKLQFRKPLRLSLTKPETFNNLLEIEVPDTTKEYLSPGIIYINKIEESNVYKCSLVPSFSYKTHDNLHEMNEKLEHMRLTLDELKNRELINSELEDKNAKYLAFSIHPKTFKLHSLTNLKDLPISIKNIEQLKGKSSNFALESHIKNLFKDKDLSPYSIILLNTNLHGGKKGFAKKREEWINILTPRTEKAKKIASDKERIKHLLKEVDYNGISDSVWNHYKNFTLQKFHEGQDAFASRLIRGITGINPVKGKVSSSIGSGLPNKIGKIHFSLAPDGKTVQITYYGPRGIQRNQSFSEDPHLYEVLKNNPFNFNTKKQEEMFDNHLRPFLKKLNVPEFVIESLKRVDDRRMAYNLLAIELKNKYKDLDKIWKMLANKTNKSISSLQNKYIIPGIL
jgi:hypothetical protein